MKFTSSARAGSELNRFEWSGQEIFAAVGKQVYQPSQSGLEFKLFALHGQTWLLVMPRWITNGRLRESTRKKIDPDVNLWRGGLTLFWRCRLAESLKFWWRSPPQLPAPPLFRTPACRTSSWMLNPRTSVTISSFCPSFVSLLVWALLFSDSCKRSWFGQEVFGNFFPRQNDGQEDRK